MLDKKWFRVLLALVLSYYVMFMFSSDIRTMLSNSVLTLPLGCVMYFLITGFRKRTEKRRLIFSVISGVLFSLIMVMGTQLYYEGSFDYFNIHSYLAILSNSFLLTMIFNQMILYIDSLGELKTVNRILVKFNEFMNSRYSFIILMLIFLIAWIPSYLGFYPGLVDVDNSYEFWMYDTGYFVGQHPIFHVILMGGFFEFGNLYFNDYNVGISLLVFFQMGVLSFAFSLLMKRLHQDTNNIYLLLFSFLYLLLNPVAALSVVSLTKDVLFTSFFLILLIDLSDVIIHDSKPKYLRIVISTILCAVLRNNAMYAFVVIVIIMFVLVKNRRKAMIAFTVGIILANLLTFSLQATHNYHPVPEHEKLGIPINQVARLYCGNSDAFSEDEKELLFSLISEEDLLKYNPFTVDNIKFYIDEDVYSENKDEIKSLWFSKLLEHPTVYLDSFLLQTVYSWYPGVFHEPYNVKYGADVLNQEELHLYITVFAPPAQHKSLWGGAEAFYREIAHGYTVQSIPVISMLLSVGFMDWLLVFTIIYSIYKKNYKVFYSLLVLLIYMLTLLLGPMVLVRYYQIVFYLMPAFIIMIYEMAIKKQ